MTQTGKNNDKAGAGEKRVWENPLSHNMKIPEELKAAIDSGDISKIQGNGLELPSLMQMVTILLQQNREAAIAGAELAHDVKSVVGMVKDPKGARAHLVSDRSWFAKVRNKVNELPVIGATNDAIGLVEESPVGWLLKGAGVAAATWFLGEKIGIFGAAGELVEDLGDVPYDK